ncbi:ABC transporter ATP-binding protein [Streptomyces sp. CB03234]|nr:ABC transporter ATP-binding protein [Streptomyces sp. CB03234]
MAGRRPGTRRRAAPHAVAGPGVPGRLHRRRGGRGMTAARRVRPEARRFLRRRKRDLLRLAAWSLLESAHTFLGGYGVARALDDGFLAGRTGTGLLWLTVAAAGTLLGGLAVRGVFGGLAGLVEPLRDGLVRRAVSHALDAAVADPARAESAAGGAAVSRLTHQTEIARDSFAGLVLTARSFVFTALGALLGMAALEPALTLVVLPPLLLGLGMFLATLAPMAAVQRAFLDADEALSARVGAVGAGLRDVVACGGERHVAAEAGRLIDAEARLSRRLARWAAVRTLALGAAGRLPVVALLLATPWLLRGGVTAGALLGALTYLVQALLPALDALMTAVGAAGTRLLVVLERFTDPPADPPARPARPRPPALLRPVPPAAELRGVTFAYGPGARPVLDGLDLVVEPGEHLAVVGPSGIGKSTLTALLAGLLAPTGGTVAVTGVPALLPQQAYVFTGTVLDNLRYLRPDATPAQVQRAVDALGLAPLIRRLGGQDAVIDPRRLSHGERQRLALGRAYLSPAPLLLLDEATCHLDPDTEEHAERALADRPGTLLVVAHRISSAVRADRVLVLDGDRAQCAPHDELLTRSQLYRDLVGLWQPDAA